MCKPTRAISRHNDIRKLRHLAATIENFVPRGRGNCFQRSVAMVMDVPTARLVIGTISSDHSYLHAWVEDRGGYIDPSDFEEIGGLIRYPKEGYTKHRRARDIHVVTRRQVLDFARRGSLSRWMLRKDETYHTLGGIMGHVLLDELRIPYLVSADGYLYPGPPILPGPLP